MRMTLLTFLAVFLLPASVFGQDRPGKPFLRLTNISEQMGMPGEFARCIMQDRLGLIWMGYETGFKYFDGYSYHHYPLEKGDIWVTALLEDAAGDIWAAASADAVYHLDRRRDVLTRYGVVRDTLRFQHEVYGKMPYSSCLYEDDQQRLWVSTYEGFKRFDPVDREFRAATPATDNFRGWRLKTRSGRWVEFKGDGIYDPADPERCLFRFRDEAGRPDSIPYSFRRIVEDRSGVFWIATGWLGLFTFDPATELLTHHTHNPESSNGISSNWVSAVLEDYQGRIWIGSDKAGLDVYLPWADSFYNYPIRLLDEHSVSGTPIFLFEDRDSGLWVSQYHGGVGYMAKSVKPFVNYTSVHGDPHSLSFPQAYSFFERPNGDIWIMTDGGGLNLWKRNEGVFQHYTAQAGVPNTLRHNRGRIVVEDKFRNVWVSTNAGVDRLHLPTGTFSYYPFAMVMVDQEGHLWGRRQGGVYRFDYQRDEFVMEVAGAHGLAEDRSGTIWIWQPGGIYPYDKANKTFGAGISTNAYALTQDARGVYWLLLPPQGDTLLGYDLDTRQYVDTLIIPNSEDHMSNGYIIDDHDAIWLTTNNGLYRYDPSSKKIDHYDYSDGLVSSYFRLAGSHKTRNGELLVGSPQGFTIFHPDSLVENRSIPPVLVTSLQLGNVEAPIRGSAADTAAWVSPLDRHIHFTDSIHLAYRQNDLVFEFAALDFANPQKNQYKYKLDGYDEDWTPATALERSAKYTNLPPGEYTFQVQASNNDGRWNRQGAQLALTIMPAWWQTGWAYALYILTIVFLFASLYLFQRRRWQMQTRLQVQREKALRLEELDAFKSRFFTNITHEFRTPLTVIGGMAEQIVAPERSKTLIRRNADRLLRMVNQLLDLARLESKQLDVDWVQGDILPLLSYLTQSFREQARSRDISLSFHTTEQALVMDFDEGMIQQILTNLLANAIKFTPPYGQVNVLARKDEQSGHPQLELTVSDTGPGIAPEELPRIFDRFYQAPSHVRNAGGSGIGLALVKELVHLLGGEVRAESDPPKGSVFRVLLPIHREAEKQVESSLAARKPVTVGDDEGEAPAVTPAFHAPSVRPLVLIVEDQPDVVEYIATCLRADYRLDVARDGRKGLEKAFERVPDLILCDVMMPGMDGLELCDQLKTDRRTSHIPVVMLTGMATQADKVAGLATGADAYLVKPFDKEELLVRLRQLIQQSRRLREALSQGEPEKDREDPRQKREARFLAEVDELLEAYIDDEGFRTGELAQALALSRTQLHRKLKALTGLPTATYIRNFRLTRAEHLLRTTDLLVAEVASQVGFGDPSHFTRSFSNLFGHNPSDLRK